MHYTHNKTHDQLRAVNAAIQQMDAIDTEYEHTLETVERLELELQSWRRSLDIVKDQLNSARETMYALDCMDPDLFTQRLREAESLARATGSRSVTVDHVTWTRP